MVSEILNLLPRKWMFKVGVEGGISGCICPAKKLISILVTSLLRYFKVVVHIIELKDDQDWGKARDCALPHMYFLSLTLTMDQDPTKE
jgi:hypothetical protein